MTSVREHSATIRHLVAAAIARRAQDEPVQIAVTAPGRHVLAADIRSQRRIPAFDNSQMDGYAVNSAELSDGPRQLAIAAHIPAGGSATSLAPGTAAPIMTGAPIPAGADAVVPIEQADPNRFGPPDGGGTVTLTGPVAPGTFVRRAGSDVSEGDVVVPSGTPLSPAARGALVAAGVSTVAVRAPVRVAVISTGDEVASGQIADSNVVTLRAALEELGVDVTTHLVADDQAAFADLIRVVGEQSDLLITTGGVSEGAYEVVRQVLGPLPSSWFGHVDVQPGGPQGWALLDIADRSVPVVCLPGNPVSVLVSYELFIRPALGAAPRPRGTAPLAEPLTSPPGRLQVRRGRIENNAVVLDGGPGSHLLSAYARSTVLAFVPEDVVALDSGDSVAWWRIT